MSVGRLGMSSRQVNLLLAAAVLGCVVTGLTSWGVGTGWSRLWTAVLFLNLGAVVACNEGSSLGPAGSWRPPGQNWIRAGAGADVIDGGPNVDEVHGGNGNDQIAVSGNDRVRGGAGALDSCVIARARRRNH
jgi:hypothetical protein